MRNTFIHIFVTQRSIILYNHEKCEPEKHYIGLIGISNVQAKQSKNTLKHVITPVLG